jgi:hypothetical protein
VAAQPKGRSILEDGDQVRSCAVQDFGWPTVRSGSKRADSRRTASPIADNPFHHAPSSMRSGRPARALFRRSRYWRVAG